MIQFNKEQIEAIDFLNRGIDKGGRFSPYHQYWEFDPGTGLVNIKGDFDCSWGGLTDFKGVRFGVIEGSFYCQNNKLTSLEGAPKEVGKYFNCSDNKLTSLEGAPQKVGKTFYCSYNKLTSLDGLPQGFDGDFYSICTKNNFPLPHPILELVFKTMRDKGVNYYRALFLNKKAIDKEINKHRKINNKNV